MEFTHFNQSGRAKMVDVGGKQNTNRIAIAQAVVNMQPETLVAIQKGGVKKGDVLAVAQVAGVMAAKHTSAAIPMCHPLMLTAVDFSFSFDSEAARVVVECAVKTNGQTGVEMEAIHGASVAAMTIYDMCKAVDRWMTISEIRLMEKRGGKTGHVRRRQVPVVCIASGCSKTGKTTLMENLIRKLSGRGYRVGAIKGDCHGFEIDVPGKDTWRFTQAGAKATAIIGPDQWALMQKTGDKMTLSSAAEKVEGVDLLLVEGFKRAGRPVIEVVRREKGTQLATSGDNLVAVATDVTELEVDVPVFSLDDYDLVAEFIIERFLSAENKFPDTNLGEEA